MTDDELLKEFLDKGGKIQKLDYVEPEAKKINVRKTTSGPATIHTLSEGEFFFAKKNKKKKKKKKQYTDEEFKSILNKYKSLSKN